MKKYLSKLSMALLFLVAFSSCEEDTVNYDYKNGKALAAFAKPTGGLPVLEEGTSTATIVVNVSTISDVDRAIDITIDDEATTANSAQYTIDESTLVVPAGSFNGEIKVTGHFSALDSNRYRLVLKLNGVAGATLEKDEESNTFALDIFKSCLFNPAAIAVNFEGKSYLDAVVPGTEATTFNPVITKVNDREYTFDTLWGSSFVAEVTHDPQYENQFVYPGKMVINDDFTLTITGTDSWAVGGTGNYDPCTNTFSYVLQQSLFGTPFPVFVELKPAP